MTWTIDAHDNRVHHVDENAATRYALWRGGEHAIVRCLCGSDNYCWICETSTNGDIA